MPSPFSSLLLVTSLWVLPGTPAQQPAVSTKAEVIPPATSAPAKQPASKAKTPGPKVSKPVSKAKATTSTKAKAAPADCDLPASKADAVKPVPVAADPLAPTLAPCAEPTRKP